MALESDPLDLKLDTTGDLALVDGDLVFISGVDAVAQLVKIVIQMFQGEWFLDIEAGVPWFQDILGQKYDQPRIRAAIRGAILSVSEVTSILSLETSFTSSTRALSVSFSVRTTFGDTTGVVVLEF